MGKGKATRRRLQNALKANQGNLAKAQRGKASANMPLPDAPKAADMQDKMPASLRRMLALKQAMEQPKGPKAAPGGGRPHPHPHRRQQHPQHSQQQQHSSAGGDGAGNEQPSTSGRREGASTGATRAALLASSVPLFEQPKRLAARKKEYLSKKKKAKKLKKRGGAGGGDGSDGSDPGGPPRLVDRVAFGERVDAPLKVQLKRKHWAGPAKSESERCHGIAEAQLRAARARLAEAAADGGGGLVAAARREAVRDHVIEAYRAQQQQRKGGGEGGSTGASLSTLKRLAAG